MSCTINVSWIYLHWNECTTVNVIQLNIVRVFLSFYFGHDFKESFNLVFRFRLGCDNQMWYLGLRSGGAKQVTVGMSSFEGFCSAPGSPRADVEAGVEDEPGALCSLFDGGCGERLCPRKPRLRFGERQRRRALNCRNSSPSRFPREVRRTGLVKLGSRRLRWERVAGERWKESSGSSPWVSTILGSLGSCWKRNTTHRFTYVYVTDL